MNKANAQRRENPTLIKTESADEIPVVHRLAIIYLMLPVLIWLLGWHQWWLGIPAVVLLVLAFREALSGSWRMAVRPLAAVLLVIALAWVMVTAAGGLFDVHNFDWIKHRAILLDLARNTWPVYLPAWAQSLSAFIPGEGDIEGLLLRYYLGYYMVPGLAGKWFGVEALNWAVPLWSWSGVALMLLMFTRGFLGWRAVAAATILIFFSGMDIVSVAVFEGLEWLDFQLSLDGWPRVGFGRDFLEWDRYLEVKVQFLSHMVGMMWVPQHFIAGALYALLLVQLRQHRRFLAVSGVVVGASLFWSPFVAVGLLPLAAVLLKENGVRPFLRWQNLLLGLPLPVLVVTYLASGTGDIPHFWLWEFSGWQNVVRGLPILYLVEFLLLTILLVLLRPQLLKESFFLASLATLLLLPLYYFGLHNDLVMRGLIPSLVLLCYYCASSSLGRSSDERRERRDYRRKILSGLIVAVLGIGAIGPVINLARANSAHDFEVFGYEQFGLEFSTTQAVGGPIVNQYLADEVPGWYRLMLRDSAKDNTLAKSELLISSIFDVYLLNDRILVYTRTPCTQDDMRAHFILSVFPLEETGNAQDTLDFEFSQGPGLSIGETCVTSRALPDYKIGRIRAGQYKLDRGGHSWMGMYLSEEYRDRIIAEAGEAVIRSNYDVYVNKKRLIFSKAACTERDVVAPFTLRVTPVDVNDLDEHLRKQGFEEFTFNFSEHGGWIGDSCLVMHELPDYAMLSITTGQHVPGGIPIWEGRFSLQK